MNNPGLEIPIKANADQLLAVFQKVQARIESLGSQIAALPDGSKQLNKLSRELARTTATAQTLADKFQSIGDEIPQTTQKFDQLSSSSKSARTALTSVSLIAQDLPFGFIAIQNNLPGVIQGFGNLYTASNNKILPALKEVGKSLIGPAGLFLAFSTVTSAVTYAIKEYGSLGNAFDAIFGKTYSFTKSLLDAQKAQKEFADQARDINQLQIDASGSYEASAIKLQTLTDIVLDANKSDKERKNALEQLKELDKERFKNFNVEKGALQGLQAATDAYTQALINNAVVKEYESEIGKVTVNLNRQRDVLFALQKQFDTLNETYPDLAEEAKNFYKELRPSPGQFGRVPNIFGDQADRITEYLDLQKKITEQERIVTQVEFVRYNQLKTELEGAIKLSNELYNPKPKKVDNSAQKAFDKRNASNLRAIIEAIKERKKINEAAFKSENDLYLQTLDERDQEIYRAGQKLNEDVLNLDKAGFQNRELALEAYRKKINEINAKYDEQDAKIREKIIKDAGEAELDAYLATLSERDAELFKREIKFYKDLAAVKKAGTTDFTLIEEGYRLDRLKINQKYDEKELKDFEKQQNRLKKQFEDIRSNLQNVFFNPLSDIFEKFLEDGTFTFEEFRKVVINNIKKMVAQLAATQILNTLASVLSGFTPGGTGSFIGNLLSGNLGGSMNRSGFEASSVAAPNIGGLSGGSLAMTGGVNLVLRGSDLVGAINRTNAQISRVG